MVRKSCWMMIFGIGFFLFLSDKIFAAAPGAATPALETKFTLESRLEERLRRVLTEIAGTEKIIVIVNVQLSTEEKKPAEKKEETILPGVPVKKKIGEEKATPLDLGEVKTLIKKLTVTIILDKAIPTKIVEIVKEVATGLVGLDAERGDQLLVQQMNFEKNPFYWGSIVYPPHLYWIIAIILVGLFILVSTIFLFGPFRNFTQNMVTAIQTTRRSEETSESRERELPIFPLTPAPRMVTHEETSIPGFSRPFSFLKEEHLRNLLFLAQKENPENIAVIINYLEPGLSAQFFSSLSPEVQTQVATNLAKISEMNPEQVRNIEEKIKTQIEYLIGGEDRISEILDYADKRTQEKILTELQRKDSILAERIKKRLFTFEDIATFEAPVIQTIYRRTNPVIFAQLLKATSEEVKNKVLSSLTTGAADRLRQEIELARPLTQRRLEEEKRKIIDLIRQLIREGIIEVRK